jgi:hypothetical protein
MAQIAYSLVKAEAGKKLTGSQRRWKNIWIPYHLHLLPIIDLPPADRLAHHQAPFSTLYPSTANSAIALWELGPQELSPDCEPWPQICHVELVM